MKRVNAIIKPFRLDDVRDALGEVGVRGIQALGASATLAWCGIATFVLLKFVNLFVPLRVSGDEETEGLDLVLHEERGYDI